MTDVVAVRNVPGMRRGQIAPKKSWMDGHIAAGNIKVLPGEQEAWEGETDLAAPEPLHQGFSTGTHSVDEDEDTDGELDDEHSDEAGE